MLFWLKFLSVSPLMRCGKLFKLFTLLNRPPMLSKSSSNSLPSRKVPSPFQTTIIKPKHWLLLLVPPVTLSLLLNSPFTSWLDLVQNMSLSWLLLPLTLSLCLLPRFIVICWIMHHVWLIKILHLFQVHHLQLMPPTQGPILLQFIQTGVEISHIKDVVAMVPISSLRKMLIGLYAKYVKSQDTRLFHTTIDSTSLAKI